MAKVYSWEVKRNPRTYAYIIHPDSVTEDENGKAISTSNPQAYIGTELKGTRLQKVIDWVQNPENDYETQFQIMVNTCANDERAKNAVFDTASSYIDLPGTCDLRGPAGRGIESVGYSHSINGESVYIIKYDDGAEDSFSVRDGKDGKDGIDGAPGAKGDTGISSKFMMVYTTGKNDAGELITPKRPEGGSYDFLTGKASYPELWSPNDSGVIPPVWMSSRTFTTSELTTDPEWSTPVQITGENGAPGVDGVSTEFIYKRTTIKPTEVGQLPSVNENGYVPTDWGWTPSPLGVTEHDPTEWCCLRKMVKDVGWGSWDGPTIWSQYGVNGQDGDGVQYIYMRNKGELPKNPTPSGWDDPTSAYQDNRLEWVPAIGSYINYTGESVTITEEYYWSDNPQDVDAKYQYQWVAVRKYRKGDNGEQMWQPFSNPTLWGKFGENGDNGTSVRTLYALSTSTSNYPTPPEGTTATGDWGSGFPKDYEFGKNVVWGITAEIWSHNNEFVDPETGWSEPFLVTGVKGKDGDAINYNSRYFAYGWVDSTPYPLSSTDPDNPGTSLDDQGRTVAWKDYPDTKNIGSDNNERRWYQCDVHINGSTQKIEKYGPVLPCNGRDGSATPGRYTEFRFAVTPTEDEPILVQFNDDGQIIREPKLFNEEHTEQWGWFTSDKELPELKSGGAVWEIWATINGATEEVIIQSDGSGWSGPLRVSGERGQQGKQGPAGLRGVTGIPGAMINPMYCLGTKGRQEKSESFFENGDGYFGSDLWKNDVLPDALTGWYKTPPYSDFLDATSTTEVNNYASVANNVGRVVRHITTKENGGVTEVYYTYYLIENLNTIKEIKKDVLQEDELFIYIWCTQGKDIWKAGTVGKEEEGDTVQHERIGVDWTDPFRLQGTNGLRGLAGHRGQVVYPMGIYNEEEVYITTDTKAPYVYDPNDGLFYVYNVVGKPWVGKLPTDYQNIKIDKNGKADDGAEYYKYSMDGTYGNWIGDQHGDTPSQNYANHTDQGSTPAWVRFESFQALYTSIGIIANGTIGSAVYNNEFMFSQQGLAADGKTFSTDYEKFLDGYKYDEKGKTESGETKHWYYKGTSNYISDREVNPYETKSETDLTCIHGFQPNVCINFKTGEMWTSTGKVNFDATGAGYIANKNISWLADGQLTIGPLNEYKNEVDATLQDLQTQLNKDLEALQSQVDKKAETYYQLDDPSEQWTNDKSEHIGDMWYNTTNHVTYRWNGNKWEEQTIPTSVFNMIDGKSAIYVSKPISDKDGDGYLYRVNDMWLLDRDYTETTQLNTYGKKGSIWISKTDRTGTTEEHFVWSDWIKKGTELDEWVKNDFPGLVSDMVEQPDGIVNTHHGKDDPSGLWQSSNSAITSTYAENHLGDLWFDTTDNKSYIYTDTTANTTTFKDANPLGYYWVLSETEIPKDLYDAIDGKCKIFVSEPRTPWNEGDLWLKNATSGTPATDIYRAIRPRESGVIDGDSFNSVGKSDWIKACDYTNDDVANQALGRLNAMGEDGYVSPEEQRRLINEKSNVDNEDSKLREKAEDYGLTDTASAFHGIYTEYDSAYNRFTASIEYYTSEINQITTSTDTHYLFIEIKEGYSGTGTTGQYYGNIAAYYGFKQDLQNALVSAAENSAAGKAYELVINDDAFINDLTVSKLNTTPDSDDTQSRILIQNNYIKCYSSTSTAETLTISGSELAKSTPITYSGFLNIGQGRYPLGSNTTLDETKVDTATTLTFKLDENSIGSINVPSMSAAQYIVNDGVSGNFTATTTTNLTLFVGTGITEAGPFTYYKTGTILSNFKHTITHNTPDDEITGRTTSSSINIDELPGDRWYEIKLIKSVKCSATASTSGMSFVNYSYMPYISINAQYDINKTEIGSNGFRMITDTSHKAEFINNNGSSEFQLYANGNGIKINDDGLFLCNNGIWVRLIFTLSGTDSTLTTSFKKV